MAGMRADPHEKATADVEKSRTGATREAAKPGSDGKLEDAVRRSMIDLEQELEGYQRQPPVGARRRDEFPA